MNYRARYKKNLATHPKGAAFKITELPVRRRFIEDMPPWEEKTPGQEERDSVRMLIWVAVGLIVVCVAMVVVWFAPAP